MPIIPTIPIPLIVMYRWIKVKLLLIFRRMAWLSQVVPIMNSLNHIRAGAIERMECIVKDQLKETQCNFALLVLPKRNDFITISIYPNLLISCTLSLDIRVLSARYL
jgi:hypothetical protein